MSALPRLTLISDGEPVEKSIKTPLPGRSAFSAPATDVHGWADAIEDFLVHVRSSKSVATVRFYHERLRVARKWFAYEGRGAAGVPLADFRARDMDQYLTYRAGVLHPRTGLPISDATRRHDAIAIKAFLKWCRREGLFDHNPLADYDIPRSDKPFIPTPTRSAIAKLLAGAWNRWSITYNPDIKFFTAKARTFYQRRNYAILSGLIASSLRIGEMLALRLDDVDVERKVIIVRKSKSKKPREVPFETDWVESLQRWLKVRPACSSPLLYITAYGEPVRYKEFLHSYHKDRAHAGAEAAHLTLHHLRHFAASAVAEVSIKAASERLGHGNIATTQAYLHANTDNMRAAVEATQPLRSVLAVAPDAAAPIMRNKRSHAARTKRLI